MTMPFPPGGNSVTLSCCPKRDPVFLSFPPGSDPGTRSSVPKARTATVCYVPCLAHLASPLLIHNSRVRDNVIFLRKRLGGPFLLPKEGSDVPFLSSRKRSWDFLFCPKGTNRHSLLRSLSRSRHISCELALRPQSMNT